MGKVSSDFAWRSVQIYLKEGAVFLLFLLAVKLLLPEQFGLYSYVSSFAYFFILMGDFGISATTAKLVAEREGQVDGEGRSALDSIFTSSLIGVLALSALSLTAALGIGYFFLGPNLSLLWYLAPSIVLAPLASFFDGYYRGQRKFKLLSSFSIAAFVVFALSAAWLVFTYGLIGALISQNIFYAAFLLATLVAQKCVDFHIDPAVVRELIHYSLIVGLGSVGYFLFTKIDIVILGKFGYLVEAANYELTTKIFSIGIISFSVFGQVIAPYLIKLQSDPVALKAKIALYRARVITGAVLVTLLAALIIPLAVSYFLPAYYTPAFLTGFMILALVLPFDLWAVVQRQGMLVPLGLASVVTVSTLVGGVLNVLLDVALIYWVGAIGVFASTVVIHIGVLFWQDHYLRRNLRTR